MRPDLRDWFLYVGKHALERYLDPRVRAGISTFGALASPAEVAAGRRRLAQDIRSGRGGEVIASSDSPDGDPTFVVAEAA